MLLKVNADKEIRMTCMVFKRRQLYSFLALWIITFIVYMYRTSRNTDKEYLKIKAPLKADDRSFEKWMQFERNIFKINNPDINHAVNKKQKQTEKASFFPLSNPKVTTVNNICIRQNQINISKIIKKGCKEQTFTLVIYKSGLNVKRRLHGFNVSYKTIPTPNGYRYVNQTAFFHGFDKFFWPDNFYHFTKQFYFPLHYLINETNSLEKKEPNIVFFTKPYYPCINTPFTDNFFPHLNIENGVSHAYYPGFHPGGVCFKNAVFSNELHLEHAEKAIVYIRKKLGATTGNCTEKNKIILLRRRKNRRIVNALRLKGIAEENGLKNFSNVYMEDLTMQEQMQTMLCTDVMIGVQGAGLQWAYFMRPLSVVIEIAWPNYGWNFFYSKLYTKEGVIKKINFMALETNEIANKTECISSHLAKHKPKITLTKDQYIMPPEDLFKLLKPTYPGKTCDVYIDEKRFLETIKKAMTIIEQ